MRRPEGADAGEQAEVRGVCAMTETDILKRLLEIAAPRRDPEVAHAKEDQLMLDILRAVANGECSREAVQLFIREWDDKLEDLDRWYA